MRRIKLLEDFNQADAAIVNNEYEVTRDLKIPGPLGQYTFIKGSKISVSPGKLPGNYRVRFGKGFADLKQSAIDALIADETLKPITNENATYDNSTAIPVIPMYVTFNKSYTKPRVTMGQTYKVYKAVVIEGSDTEYTFYNDRDQPQTAYDGDFTIVVVKD